jgi:hypothetical protein
MSMPQPVAAHEIEPIKTVIDGSLPGGFTLRDPVDVDVWKEGAEYVAAAPSLLIHAFGVSVDDAMANLRHEIVMQVRRLEDLGDRLAPRMVAQRDQLRRLVVRDRA